MIITNDDKLSAEQEGTPISRPIDVVSGADVPPPYEQHGTSGSLSPVAGPSTSSLYSIPPIPTGVTAMNFLDITRTNDSVKGKYLIDLGLHIPKGLLSVGELDSSTSQSESEAGKALERPNLRLKSTNGSIAADIWLVNRSQEGSLLCEKKRAQIEIKSTNGSIRAHINADIEVTPIVLSVSTTNGSMSILIPRTFVGPVTSTTNWGNLKLSKAVEESLHTFSDIKGKRMAFMGDFSKEGLGNGEWHGSSLDISSNLGSVKLSFVGENEEAPRLKSEGPSFWSRLLGSK